MKKCLGWILPMLLVACATPNVEVSQDMPAQDSCCSEAGAQAGGDCCAEGGAKAEVKAESGCAGGGCCMGDGMAKPAPVKTNN
ncbi:MAG: hypothetical protein R3F29_10975 [Planctomycetota bacterium]